MRILIANDDGIYSPGIATLAERDEPNLIFLKPSLEKVLALLLQNRDLSLVNVNFPDEEPKGLRWTRQSVRHYDGKVMPGEDPLGRKLFWFTVVPDPGDGGGH